MAKRLLAWLMMLAMLLSVVPAISLGAGAQETDAGISQLSEGSQKLTGNMTLKDVWEISGEVELDLNGYTLILSDGGKLVIPAGGKLTCKNGTITGAINGAIDVSGTLELTKVTMTGNTTAGTGAAIAGKGSGQITLTDVIITANTAAAGAAVSVTDSAKLTVSGDTVIADNTNAANTADVAVADKLYVNELTGGSNITVQTPADQTSAGKVIALNGKQTAVWYAGWVTYMKRNGSEVDIGYITSGSDKVFTFGHYHGDQKYTAYGGGTNHNLLKSTAGYYYLNYDVVRSATSSAAVSLDKDATQHLCLNGHTVTHRNPEIRLYNLDAGDNLVLEDCTSYYNEKDQFVAGGILFGGASDSTSADGSFALVNAGAQLTLENIRVTGFHSTVSPALRVKGEAANRGVLNMTGVEMTDNSNAGTAAVLYATTGATVNMTDCVFKNNTAKAASVISSAGDAQITVADCIATGNTASSYGTFNVSNGKTVFKLVGATQVYDNAGGNLHLQKGDAYVYDLDGLTEGAKVGITLHKNRIAENQMHFTTVVAEGKDPAPYCFSDDDAYKVAMDEKGRLALVENVAPITHTHKLCNDPACTDHGEDVTFEPWEDATKLPETSGKYYLTTDVTVGYRAGLTDADVTLCLNGYTIQAADSYAKARAFYLRGTSKLTITDCAATPGKITGFKASAIMCDSGCVDAAINIYNIEISGNANSGAGGAIVLQGVNKFHLYSGKIIGNTASGNGAAIYMGGTTTAKLLGGEITGNTASINGGGIHMEGSKVTVDLTGTRITGNTASANGGGIYVKNQVGALNISGDAQITGNTAKGAANNLHLAGSTKFNAGKLGEHGNVGIDTDTYFRPVSNEAAEDVSAGYYSDNKTLAISYQDKALFLGAPDGHSHCFCAGENNRCDHVQVKFAPWEDTNSLPESGNWYLTTDVVVTYRAGLKDMNLNLCLNGHTIRVAEDYAKGRVFYLYGNSKLTITDCNETPGVITNANESAIMFDSSCDGAAYNMYNITMSGNSSTTGGGAVLVQGTSSFNMYSGSLTDNTVSTTLILDADGNPQLDADGNQTYKSSLGGGAICSSGTKTVINLYGGKLSGNSAAKLEYLKADGTKGSVGGNGGAIYAKGELNMYDGVEISGNTAEGSGGGVLVGGNDTTVTIHGGRITGNTGTAGGGLISQNRTNVVMNGGVISGNRSTKNGAGVYVSINSGFTMNGGTISGNIATKDGAGMYAYASVLNLNAGTLKNNKAGGSGGGISSAKGTVTVDGEKVDRGANITIGKNFSVTGNYAAKNAGGIMLSGKTGVLTLDGGSISNNTAKSAAGGVLVQSSGEFVMRSGKISNNTAKVGGGVYISTNCSFKLQSGAITGNKATSSAGGIYFLRSKAVFSGGTISNNGTETGSGGGIYMKGASVQMYGTYIGYNKVVKSGGAGIYATRATVKDEFDTITTVYRCDLRLSDCTVEYNEAKSGGGIYTGTGVDLNITGGSLRNNTALSTGGAAYHGISIVNYNDVKVYNNTTESSHGTVYLGSKGVTSDATAAFTNCKFYNNQVGLNGGAVYGGQNCLATLTDCIFTENTAGEKGGAILCRGNMTMTNCRVENNTAAVQGGGIATGKSGITGSKIQEGMVLVNTVVANNTTNGQGGGLYLSTGCKVTMNDVQIIGNKAAAEGGAYWAVDDTNLRNVTVTGNTSGGQGYAAWYDNAIFDGHSYFVGVHKISGDIIFKDNEGGDMYFGQDVAMSVSYEGLGEKTHFGVTLDSGLLTNRLYGEYHYEGGNQVYTVTYGNRSYADSEVDETMMTEDTQPTEQIQKTESSNLLLYVGVGLVALILIAVAAILVIKKKAGKPAEKANKE